MAAEPVVRRKERQRGIEVRRKHRDDGSHGRSYAIEAT